MNVPAVDGGLLKPDVVEGTDDEVPYFDSCVSEVGLVGTEGIVEASELGGGYGGFGGKWLRALLKIQHEYGNVNSAYGAAVKPYINGQPPWLHL
ncbi:hypothetical protein Syun_018158 [Stephania yunnanensis]|uniref:Uncharacterized protein n=1 Tax=Stephania yunnanensis TaxID=152371 RepID=A0AAP0IU01_9MAGN